MTKNEFKAIAKTAKRILGTEKDANYNGDPYYTEAEVSYNQMIEELSHCSRWSASQFDNTIFVSGTAASFTVML